MDDLDLIDCSCSQRVVVAEQQGCGSSHSLTWLAQSAAWADMVPEQAASDATPEALPGLFVAEHVEEAVDEVIDTHLDHKVSSSATPPVQVAGDRQPVRSRFAELSQAV